MEWKAAVDRVVIRPDEIKKQTASGLYLPDKTANGPVARGIVLAAGPAADGVKVGDTVFFFSRRATEVEQGVASVNAEDIVAINREE